MKIALIGATGGTGRHTRTSTAVAARLDEIGHLFPAPPPRDGFDGVASIHRELPEAKEVTVAQERLDLTTEF